MNAPASALLALACLLPATALPSAASRAPQTLRYTILASGRVAGSEIDTYHADGRIECSFEFNDRGRGPKLTARYRLNGSGVPLRTDITGFDYLKVAVDEHFEVAGGKATWHSPLEHGQAGAGGFYVGNSAPAAELAFLAAALGRTGNHTLPLLPGGEARLERLADTTIDNGHERIHVTEYAVGGLGFQPQTVWLDDQRRLFATPGTTFAVLRSGWEQSNARLHEFDLKAQDARLLRLARELARQPTHPVAIEHVRVFDSEQAVGLDDQTVIVDGERIAAVGPAAAVSIAAGAERIDGRGRTLLPGLFDMHVHADGAAGGLLHIASGVTSVRDMGNDIEELARIRLHWTDGTAIGPRLWMAGMIDGKDPLQAPTALFVSTAEEAQAAVNRYADLGYVQVKLYSSLAPELVPGIIRTAHARGLRVSGHVPNGMIATQFVEAGADELQHINFIFLNFLAGQVKDTRTPERFTAVAANAAKLDLQSPPVEDFMALLRRHRTAVDVTLVAFEAMFTGRPGSASADMAPVLERLPAQVRRGAFTGFLPVDASNDALYRESYRAMLRMTKRLYDAGVQILAGTDSIPGIMLHRELELEVQAGIPAPKALQIATLTAATLLRQESQLGSVSAGKRADLVLVDGNPLDDISALRRVRLVFKNGVSYRSAQVYAAAGIGPAP